MPRANLCDEKFKFDVTLKHIGRCTSSLKRTESMESLGLAGWLAGKPLLAGKSTHWDTVDWEVSSLGSKSVG